MKYYFAPMEGITGYVFRNAHHKFYGEVDSYYAPFVSPGQSRKMSAKEYRDLRPENNVGTPVVPQVLTNIPERFLDMAYIMQEMGYEHVNLNLGCPSGTVVAKGKGSGFLRTPDHLHKFLEDIFEKCPLEISVKTRLGIEAPEEFRKILSIFNEYPIEQLTVHPRVQKDYYREPVREEWFQVAYEEAKMPLCYNGEMHAQTDIQRIQQKYPEIEGIMIGRGLLRRPDLLVESNPDIMLDFHEELWNNYKIQMGEERNAMFRMKELWSYLCNCFVDSDKVNKKIRKTKNGREYDDVVREIFANYAQE